MFSKIYCICLYFVMKTHDVALTRLNVTLFCELESWNEVWLWTVQPTSWMRDGHLFIISKKLRQVGVSRTATHCAGTPMSACAWASVCGCASARVAVALAPLCFISIRAQRLGWATVTWCQREIELNVSEPPWAFHRFGRHTTQTWVTSEIQLSS